MASTTQTDSHRNQSTIELIVFKKGQRWIRVLSEELVYNDRKFTNDVLIDKRSLAELLNTDYEIDISGENGGYCQYVYNETTNHTERQIHVLSRQIMITDISDTMRETRPDVERRFIRGMDNSLLIRNVHIPIVQIYPDPAFDFILDYFDVGYNDVHGVFSLPNERPDQWSIKYTRLKMELLERLCTLTSHVEYDANIQYYTLVAEYSMRLLFQGVFEGDFAGCLRLSRAVSGGF